MRKEVESLLCVAFDTGSDDKSFDRNVTSVTPSLWMASVILLVAVFL